MKRRVLILSSISASIFGLAACGESASTASTASASAPAPTTPADKYALAATAEGFTVGQAMAANTVYVFFDAQCPHCATLWKSAQPLLGKVRMKWIPVGLLNASSTSQGAFILGSADPAAAMNEHEALLAEKRGGISVPLSGVAGDLRDKVLGNTNKFKLLGAESIPFIVFKNNRTGQADARPGSMGTEALAELLGL